MKRQPLTSIEASLAYRSLGSRADRAGVGTGRHRVRASYGRRCQERGADVGSGPGRLHGTTVSISTDGRASSSLSSGTAGTTSARRAGGLVAEALYPCRRGPNNRSAVPTGYGRCRRRSDLQSEAFNVRRSVPRPDTSVRWAAAAPLPAPPLPSLHGSSREGQADDRNAGGRRATSPDTEPNRADCLLRRSEHAAEVNAPDPTEIRGERGRVRGARRGGARRGRYERRARRERRVRRIRRGRRRPPR